MAIKEPIRKKSQKTTVGILQPDEASKRSNAMCFADFGNNAWRQKDKARFGIYSLSVTERAGTKIRRMLRHAATAWWVLLIIAGYSVFAGFFLGSSCLFASTTGLPCPGCGSTRAFVALLNGDVAESLRLHPLLVPSLVVTGIYFIVWFTSDDIPRWMEIVLIALVIGLIVLYAVRMLMYFPHETPMTYNNQAVLPRLVRLIFSATH